MEIERIQDAIKSAGEIVDYLEGPCYPSLGGSEADAARKLLNRLVRVQTRALCVLSRKDL